MSIRALNPFKPEWHTPAGQAEGEPITRFFIQGLTGSQQSEVAPEITTGPGGDMDITAKALYLLIKYGLVDWDNFENAAGPVKFSGDARANQDAIPYIIQTELAGRIFELTFISDEQKKNSNSGRNRKSAKRV